MAYTEFHLVGGANSNDLNAGSTSADSGGADTPSVTSTNGDWDNAAANRFTAAGGATPFTGVSVGEYASIYLDAATVAVFVSKITAVDAGGTYIEVSKTAHKLGTAPAAGATGRSCRVGGAWRTVVNLLPSLMGAQTLDQPTRINHKNGTYACTIANVTMALAGTAANPIWWRGYNATPGDLSEDNANAPTITVTTGQFRFYATNGILSNVKISASSANTAGAATCAGGGGRVYRVSVINAGTTAAYAFAVTNGNWVLDRCYFQAPTGATTCVLTPLHLSPVMNQCVIVGGAIGIKNPGGANPFVISNCVIRDTGGDGLNHNSGVAAGGLIVTGCTFRNCGGDGIATSKPPPNTWSGIRNNLFAIIGGYGINYSGADTIDLCRIGNDFYSCTSGAEHGFGDSPAFAGQTDTSDPTTSSTDMTVPVGRNARGAVAHFQYEGESYSSYRDIGAVQHQDAGGGGVPLVGEGLVY